MTENKPLIIPELVALDADAGPGKEDVIEFLAATVAGAGRASSPDGLAADAKSVLAKIDAVLPGHLKEHLNTQALYPRPCQTRLFTPQESETLSAIRTALRGNRVLSFDYTDAQGRPTRRSVRPLAVGYFPDACLLAAWCEKRRDFRHFRTDRMSNLNIGDTFPVPRMVLLREWQRQEDLDLSVFEI